MNYPLRSVLSVDEVDCEKIAVVTLVLFIAEKELPNEK